MGKALLIILIMAVLLSGLAVVTQAGPQDFVLVNRTGVDVYGIFVSPSNSNNWEENVLRNDVLYNGSSIRITFSNYYQTYWDLMIKDRNGNSLYWRNLNLRSISKVYLYYNGSIAWAEFE